MTRGKTRVHSIIGKLSHHPERLNVHKYHPIGQSIPMEELSTSTGRSASISKGKFVSAGQYNHIAPTSKEKSVPTIQSDQIASTSNGHSASTGQYVPVAPISAKHHHLASTKRLLPRTHVPSPEPIPSPDPIPSPVPDRVAVPAMQRKKIELINEELHPSHVSARKIRIIFSERMDENGDCWKNVSNEMKEFYWGEFQKYFIWDDDSTLIKLAWKRKAGERYSALMCEYRKLEDKPAHITDIAWKKWNKAWNTENYIFRREIATANRLSETGGEGGGVSRHSGGSISHITHTERLAVELKRTPLPHELFERTHTRKGTNELVDKRARNTMYVRMIIIDMFKNIYRLNFQKNGSDVLEVDHSTLFFESLKIADGRKMYGLGSMGYNFYPSQFKSSSSTTYKQTSTLYNEVIGLRSEVHELRQEKENLWKEVQLQHESMKKELQDYREEVMRDVRDIMQEMRGKRARYSSPSVYDDFVE
ncbi:hypothetical protein ACFE04_016736 [Oxalis oulophora]